MKLNAKRTLVMSMAAVCLSTQLAACGLETAVILGGAAVVTGGLIIADRRPFTTYSKDAWIDIQAASPLGDIGTPKDTHIIANAFNGKVLLTGEVANDADKQKATDAVKAISGVNGVDNQLTIGPVTSLATRNNDSFITSKVKSRLVNDHPELGNAFKIVTENGVVYVLGNLTQSELERGIEITRTTAGVQRVVKTSLITIIKEPQAQALDKAAQEDASKTQGTVTPLPSGDQQPTTQGVN